MNPADLIEALDRRLRLDDLDRLSPDELRHLAALLHHWRDLVDRRREKVAAIGQTEPGGCHRHRAGSYHSARRTRQG